MSEIFPIPQSTQNAQKWKSDGIFRKPKSCEKVPTIGKSAQRCNFDVILDISTLINKHPQTGTTVFQAVNYGKDSTPITLIRLHKPKRPAPVFSRP